MKRTSKDLVETIVDAFSTGVQSALFWGPPGTGKSSAAIEIAKRWANGTKPIQRVYCHPEMDVTELVGGLTLVDGKTEWKPAPPLLCYKEGGVLILDELSLAPASVAPPLMALLDDLKVSFLDTPIGRFEPHPDFRVLVTQNHSPSSLLEPLQDRIALKIHIPSKLFPLPSEWEAIIAQYGISTRDAIHLMQLLSRWDKEEKQLRKLLVWAFGKNIADALRNERLYEEDVSEWEEEEL